MKYIICEKLAALRSAFSARKMGTRLLALLLALVLLQGDFMLPAYATEGEDSDTSAQTSTETTTTDIPSSVQEQAEQAELPVDEDTLIVTLDGAETSFFELPSHEKAELFAEGLEQQADYQWQIRHPENGAWINIYDATEQRLSVSAALVKNMLSEDGTATLRCRAYTEEYAYLSNSIRVALLENIESVADSVQLLSLDDPTVPLADGDDPLPEFVTITIQYLRYDNVLQSDGTTFVEMEIGQAFTSYVATVKSTEPGEDPTPLSAVHCPTIVGYTPRLTSITKGGNELSLESNDFQTTVTDGVSNYYVHFREEPFTADLVYRVEYHPAEVQYKIRYFFQNIYDDLYVENADLVKTSLGKTSYPLVENDYTGKHPDKNYTEAQFSGFTSLYYEPEFIAADGSTIFEVYYERNYYLMEFDCNEGYGTDTVYVRYGTYISVPDPVRSGWVFAGWDLVKTDDPNNTADLGTEILDGNNASTGFHTGDGTKNALPSAMPAYNSAYKALWAQGDTTYTVSYWAKDNGVDTYLGSVVVNEKSGNTASGSDDLEGKRICGFSTEHTHVGSCFSCGLLEHTHQTHTHDQDCYSYVTIGNVVTNTGDLEAINAANTTTPNAGDVFFYFIQASWDDATTYWPKIFINGEYRDVSMDGSSSISADKLDSITDGTEISRGTSGDYTAIKYVAKSDCGSTGCDANCTLTEHTHDTSCSNTCNLAEHTHSDAECKQNTHYLNFLPDETDKDVLIEGDGSTVVNVYYSHKLYTMRFYYAKSTTNTDSSATYSVVGGTTYPFGSYNSTTDENTPLQTLLENVTQWGEVQDLPAINANYSSRYVTGSTTYGDDTYYYLEFTAPYGSLLENLWPIGIFDPVKIVGTHSQCSYDEAFFSAWNGEYRVKYTQDNSSRQDGNETIKGLYMYLDENIIFDSQFTEVAHTDTYGNSTSLVNFLGFWDNGANIGWSIPRLYTYNLWLETFDDPSSVQENDTTKIRDGKVYTKHKTFDVYDNSYASENHHTTSAVEGYTCGANDVVITIDSQDVADVMDQYTLDFYYQRQQHKLFFWNHNRYLTNGGGVALKYGTALKLYAVGTGIGNGANDLVIRPANYPSGLEPGAYEFAGWYTTPNCLDGTQVNWDTITMPDGDLTVYAHWTPVIRNVYFYYDYADYAHAKTVNFTDTNDFWFHTENGVQVPDEYPIEVEHGSLVGTTYSNIPDEQSGYTFVGWFYMDESNKKRFAPDSMEVKRDLHLFAEWQSGIDTQYTVTYVLNQAFGDCPAGTAVASPTIGHLTAGKTKTFSSKVGSELLAPFNTANLFPLINSHSILMDADQSKNTYEFRYLQDESVWYKVRYVNKITGVEMCDPKIETSTSAIITEKFLPFTGFIPDNYYIRKALAYDGEATEPSDQNEIIFYYTPDQEHGLFVIEYYTEKLDGNWYLEQSEIGSEDLNVNKTVTIDPDRFTGFDYLHTEITTYNAEGNPKVETTTDQSVSGAITQNGLEFRVYYTRKSYDYIVEFLEVGTNKLLGYGRVDSTGEILENDGTRVFNLPDSTQHKYKSTIQYVAPDLIEQTTTKYLFYSTAEKPQTQSLIIDASNTETVDGVTTRTSNVLTFYYKARAVVFEYKAVCPTAPDAANFGRVSLESETVSNTTNISGATAIPGVGFNFVGWYSDEACTDANQISANLQFKPQSIPNDVDNVTYYARFDPALTSMKLTKSVNVTSNDTFLFLVEGLGKHDYLKLTVAVPAGGTVIIAEIPIDEYKITELTAWSWEYSKPTAITANAVKEGSTTVDLSDASITFTLVEQSGTNNYIQFANEYANPDWLGGESAVTDNIFN